MDTHSLGKGHQESKGFNEVNMDYMPLSETAIYPQQIQSHTNAIRGQISSAQAQALKEEVRITTV